MTDKNTIVITVHGGIVQDISALPEGIRLLVIDYDNGESGNLDDDDPRLITIIDTGGDKAKATIAEYVADGYVGEIDDLKELDLRKFWPPSPDATPEPGETGPQGEPPTAWQFEVDPAAASTQKRSAEPERPEAPTEHRTVDLIAAGYEWNCPACEEHNAQLPATAIPATGYRDPYNREIEALVMVTCRHCATPYTVNEVHHAEV